ncbi:hypothetical protein BC938DRAFT_474077 [Jimgerdemannia flammicorona]|uniref:Uncharacterized protein n=1 Tax=Jimgerdemannia flammicorona TaxID=994334 RepID=A0A433QSU4_9FUNG|nr:hypothetical protein BC938DRAFT_474077 [Jimgerdemannia flammicorona]
MTHILISHRRVVAYAGQIGNMDFLAVIGEGRRLAGAQEVEREIPEACFNMQGFHHHNFPSFPFF